MSCLFRVSAVTLILLFVCPNSMHAIVGQGLCASQASALKLSLTSLLKPGKASEQDTYWIYDVSYFADQETFGPHVRVFVVQDETGEGFVYHPRSHTEFTEIVARLQDLLTRLNLAEVIQIYAAVMGGDSESDREFLASASSRSVNVTSVRPCSRLEDVVSELAKSIDREIQIQNDT